MSCPLHNRIVNVKPYVYKSPIRPPKHGQHKSRLARYATHIDIDIDENKGRLGHLTFSLSYRRTLLSLPLNPTEKKTKTFAKIDATTYM